MKNITQSVEFEYIFWVRQLPHCIVLKGKKTAQNWKMFSLYVCRMQFFWQY